MKYCLKYTNRTLHLGDADEITIKYIEDKGLVDFLKKYQDKRINLSITADTFSQIEVNKLIAIHTQYPDLDFAVALDKYFKPLMDTFRLNEIKYYLAEPCQDWETFWHLATDCKVSDINLSGALGFELTKAKRCLEKVNPNCQIRVTPNKVQSQTTYIHPLQMFFIRPDDIDLYENYVDIIEFEGLEHQDTFYDLYVNQKTFIGKVSQMIYNFKLPFDNLGLSDRFGERRIDCGRECLYGGRCQRCFTLAQVSEKIGTSVREKIKENLEKSIGDN